MCIYLCPEFDCLKMTLCGWQDIKIQLLLLILVCKLLVYRQNSTPEEEGPKLNVDWTMYEKPHVFKVSTRRLLQTPFGERGAGGGRGGSFSKSFRNVLSRCLFQWELTRKNSRSVQLVLLKAQRRFLYVSKCDVDCTVQSVTDCAVQSVTWILLFKMWLFKVWRRLCCSNFDIDCAVQNVA